MPGAEVALIHSVGLTMGPVGSMTQEAPTLVNWSDFLGVWFSQSLNMVLGIEYALLSGAMFLEHRNQAIRG